MRKSLRTVREWLCRKDESRAARENLSWSGREVAEGDKRYLEIGVQQEGAGEKP